MGTFLTIIFGMNFVLLPVVIGSSIGWCLIGEETLFSTCNNFFYRKWYKATTFGRTLLILLVLMFTIDIIVVYFVGLLQVAFMFLRNYALKKNIGRNKK